MTASSAPATVHRRNVRLKTHDTVFDHLPGTCFALPRISDRQFCRYRMDYMKFVEYHRQEEADITVGCLPVDYARASDFGLMNIDGTGRITVSSLPMDVQMPCYAHPNALMTCR